MVSNIILRAELSQKPSCPLATRFALLITKENLELNNLILVDKEFVDIYHKFLKDTGIWDFIDDIITPDHIEDGIMLDWELNYPMTILVKEISWKNLNIILGQVDYLRRL